MNSEQKLKELVIELLKKKFQISGVFLMPNGDIGYQLNGFYKSSGVRLYHDGCRVYAESRYGQITDLSEYETPFEGLVYLNYEWWITSKDRYEGWNSPDVDWLPYLVGQGLVQVEEKVVKVYK